MSFCTNNVEMFSHWIYQMGNPDWPLLFLLYLCYQYNRRLFVSPWWVQTQQTFISALVLNSNPDCSCSKKCKHTFEVLLPVFPHDNNLNKRFLFAEVSSKNEINKGSKSFRGCTSAVFLGDKGPNSKRDWLMAPDVSGLLVFHKTNCFH